MKVDLPRRARYRNGLTYPLNVILILHRNFIYTAPYTRHNLFSQQRQCQSLFIYDHNSLVCLIFHLLFCCSSIYYFEQIQILIWNNVSDLLVFRLIQFIQFDSLEPNGFI